ncbi:MAG TPA: phosphoribosylaminoimidazolesuccinocarboxamide synthase [Acidimicrobiales bacterium]|jgi:phosphoribosylaminoimidazole-succinocarboxamide synthase|nr:phosphoribosylaminoimidazolesuccinocarboxamide synthase [Acidimicrobiales bacterium]
MTLPLVSRGKVRDIYDAGGGRLLMVTSDRISAFDVVMAEPIADKGRVLTAMTAFWLDMMHDLVPNHLISTVPPDEAVAALGPDLDGRVMLVHKADMLPIECIVRGYVSGSAWKEYRQRGTIHGIAVPAGLEESAKLPEPLFTPSTKAEVGLHDENISPDDAMKLVGADVYEKARHISLAVYTRAAEHAAERGILLADTKFELGWIDGELALCDEVLTPDSSRFWEAETWQPGTTPPSFDKQPLRDWLESTDWDKTPPAPFLPYEVVRATRARYRAAYERITGRSLADWPGVKGG